jgi:hypothetical protein
LVRRTEHGPWAAHRFDGSVGTALFRARGNAGSTMITEMAGSHGYGWSSLFAVALKAIEGEELRELVVGFEGIGSQLIEGPHWPGVLGGEQLRHRQPRLDWLVGGLST